MKIGFCSALFLVFLTLKLTNTINWSWWWITSPLWIDFILSVVHGVISIIEKRKKEIEEELEEDYRKLHPEKKSKFMDLLEKRMKESEEVINAAERARKESKHRNN